MIRKSYSILLTFIVSFFFVACSSTPNKTVNVESSFTPADTLAIKVATAPQKEKIKQDLDVAHESFIRAIELEMRGEKAMAEIFWQRAYEADPESRYLSFVIAERIAAHGEDSVALILAQRANTLKGRATVSQYDLLAKLFVKAGIADSARRYFNLALDSSRYQDMGVLYDYSLFLEAVHDAKELVRIYDILLPQLNYIQTLFQRQLALLVEMKRDSAIIDLFGKAHEANGDKKLLSKMVKGLLLQKRVVEAQKIADTLTTSTEDDIAIISIVALIISEKNKSGAISFLKKKINEDKIDVPELVYTLANYEYAENEIDSAKVHFSKVYPLLTENKTYITQICRALAGIAVVKEEKKEAIKYALKVDSIMDGNEKDFVAMTYGFIGKYTEAYAILDSLKKVWFNWTPMEGIADSASIALVNEQVKKKYLHVQRIYANVLLTEASAIEDDGNADSLTQVRSQEIRAKADAILDSIIALDSTNITIQYSKATNLERMGKYDESFAVFERLMSLQNLGEVNRADLLNYYGYSLIERNQSEQELDKGISLVEQALELTKNETPNEAFLDSKAWGLYKKGKYAEAYEVIKKINSENFFKDYVYWEHLAAIQAALGLETEAKQSYKKLLKLRPKHSLAKEYLNNHKK